MEIYYDIWRVLKGFKAEGLWNVTMWWRRKIDLSIGAPVCEAFNLLDLWSEVFIGLKKYSFWDMFY